MCTRANLLSITLVSLMSLHATTFAQNIVVIPRADDYEWTVNFSRVHGPDVFELDSFHSTLAAARNRAQELVQWSNSMESNSGWRLAIIQIEGADSRPRPSNSPLGPKLPAWSPVSREFVQNLDNATIDVFLHSENSLRGAYERAAIATEFLFTNVPALTDEKFSEVNGLITEFNDQVDVLQSGTDGEAFSGVPKMQLVMDETIEEAENWREAVQEQFFLEEEYDELSNEQEELVEDRKDLIDERQSIKALEQEVEQLTNQATETQLAGRTATGTWTRPDGKVIQVSYQFLSGNRLRYSSERENLEGTYSVNGNQIRMRMGNTSQTGTIKGDSISMSTQTANTGSGSETIRVTGLISSVAQAVRPKQDELRRRRTSREQQVSAYRTRMRTYNDRRQNYNRRNQTLRQIPVRRPTGRPFVPASLGRSRTR